MKLNKTDYSILIVDSSEMIVQRLDTLLKEMNCSNCVASASTYADAIEKLSAETYDVILLDTQLPGKKNGFELLAFIKKNSPEAKTIMITNQTSDFYRSEALRIGVDHFIDKSGEFDQLVEIIKDYSVGYQVN